MPKKRFVFYWDVYLSLQEKRLREDLLSVTPNFQVVILTTGAWFAINKATVNFLNFQKHINLTFNAVASLKKEVGFATQFVLVQPNT